MADPDVVLTSEQVIALVERTTDKNWFNGMMDQPDGQALLIATGAMGAAVSQCLDEQVAACKISEAPTGSPGVCSLVIHRDTTTATGTIRPGFKFVTSIGVELAVSTTVAVTAGQATVTLPLQTLRQLDLVNKRTPAFDEMVEDGDYLDPIIVPESITVLDDLGVPLLGIGANVFTYVSSSPITGATMDWLSEHGNERGCRRQPGEEGDAYRARVRQIPDAVTPVAIQEAVHGAQAQADLPSTYMVEPHRDQASDAARAAIGLIFADGPACDEGFCDDPFGKNLAGKQPLRTHEVSGLREGRAYFRESIVGPLLEPNGLVMYTGASFCDDDAWGYPDVGQHPYLTGALRSIAEEARAKRAGGVQFDVMVENATVLNARNGGIDPVATVLWTLQASAGAFWLIREGLVTCDVNGVRGIDPATDEFAIRLTLEDGTVLTSAWFTDPCGLPFRPKQMEAMRYWAQWVTKIEGLVRSSIHAPVDAVFAHGGCGPYLFEYGWTQTSSGVWTCDTTGTGALEDFIDDVSLVKGMRLAAWHESLPEADWPRAGLYVVEETGLDEEFHLINAVVRRATDADTAAKLEPGAVVHIAGGTVYGGKALRLPAQSPVTLESTPLYWELLNSYPRATETNLLNLLGTFWVTERIDP